MSTEHLRLRILKIKVRNKIWLKRLSFLTFIHFLCLMLIYRHGKIRIEKSLDEILDKFNYFEGLKTDSLCELPRLNIWNSAIKKLLKHEPVFNQCLNNTPLSFIRGTRIFIDDEIKRNFYPEISHCQLAPVIRSPINNDNFVLGEFRDFTFRDFSNGLLLIYDCIQVRCFENYTSLVYEYVHYVFPKAEDIQNRPVPNKKGSNQRLNVLILIFDSVSASSFKRSLPMTFDFLKGYENFFHFTKHHTVGQNTLPNIVPMLSGRNSDELLGNATFPPPFDDFPFIWKNFSKSNYVTYLNEDWRNSMFNNDKFGFLQSPTDYYLKHFWLALYNSKSSAPNIGNSNNNPCYYDKLYHLLLFDWLREFQQIYGQKDSQNSFGIVKSNEMSHDYLERLAWIDEDLTTLLKDLFTETFLDNTLLILMGDHGHRFHPIRHTFTGRIEERLPFFSMMVPRILLKKNPFLAKILNKNTQRLTTFYDVYETLLQLLADQTNLEPTESIYLNEKLARSSLGFSLFWTVPHRNCSQAQIPEYLCSCYATNKINCAQTFRKTISQAAIYLVNYINGVLLVNHTNICMPLKLKSIIDSEINYKLLKYSITFETNPNGAIFDGSVKLKENTIDTFELIGLISRVNLYGSTANCMDSNFLKNYCYCSYNNISINATTGNQ